MELKLIPLVFTPNIDLIVSSLNGLKTYFRSLILDTGVQVAEFEKEVGPFAAAIRSGLLDMVMSAATIHRLVTWGHCVDNKAVLAIGRALKSTAFHRSMRQFNVHHEKTMLNKAYPWVISKEAAISQIFTEALHEMRSECRWARDCVNFHFGEEYDSDIDNDSMAKRYSPKDLRKLKMEKKIKESEDCHAFAALYDTPSAEEVNQECLKCYNRARVAAGETELNPNTTSYAYAAAVELYHKAYLACHIQNYASQEPVAKAIKGYVSWRLEKFRDYSTENPSPQELQFKTILYLAGLSDEFPDDNTSQKGEGGGNEARRNKRPHSSSTVE